MLAILFYSTFVLLSFHFILQTSSDIVLNINDEKQPLVCELSTENKYFSVISAICNPDYPNQLIFSSETDASLITACPLKDPNSDIPEMVSENKNNEITCRDTPVPVITRLPIGDEYKCGISELGSWHAAGYRVRTLSPFLHQNIHFAGVFYICYSESKGVLYTLHSIFYGKRVKPFTTWKKANNEKRFKSDLISNLHHIIDPENENMYEIQLVPFDDMIPMPWKYATLFNFNFVSTNKRVKTAFDKLDEYLRSYTENTLFSLQVVSGIKIIPKTSTSEEINWYWRMIVNRPIAVIFMVADTNVEPQSNEMHMVQCRNLPRDENFFIYGKQIPNLLCCRSEEAIMNDLNITLSPIIDNPYLFL